MRVLVPITIGLSSLVLNFHQHTLETSGRGVLSAVTLGLVSIFAKDWLSLLASVGTLTTAAENIPPLVFIFLGYVILFLSFVPLLV